MKNRKKSVWNSPLLSLLTALVIAAAVSSTAWAGPNNWISSDGTNVHSASAGDPQTNKSGIIEGFKGQQEINNDELEKAGVSFDGIVNGALASEIMEAEKNLIPASPYGENSPAIENALAPESVIGVDRRQRLFTLNFPARAVVFFTFENFICSGWMIGPDTVMTAGHCVHSGGTNGRFYNVATYQVYPGRDGATAPFGVCGATKLFTVVGWVTDGKKMDWFDYGAIKLNCNVGNSTGWFGWTSAKNMKNQPTIIQGYPGDIAGTNQWFAADIVRCLNAGKLFYSADTGGGQSGSPIWNDTIANGAIAMGIHAYGFGGKGCYAKYNSGTRITPAVSTNMLFFRNAPK